MTTTDIAVRRQAAAIPAKLQYAHELANSGLLPSQYRRNPANVLWAVEYGEMLGLPPMAAMTGVHVIEGKPTASAGLISALVRRAGHKLRVRGDSKSATCQIIRADDPDFTFEVTWTLRKNGDDNPSAEEAGLLGKGVWKNYPASMLKSRAITQCARDACEEALFGLHYTAEELGAEVDEDGAVVAEIVEDGSAQRDGNSEDQWYVRPSPEQEWLAAEIDKALTQPTIDACKEPWQTSVKHVNDGKLTRDEVTPLQNRLRARIKELQDAAEAAAGNAEEPAEAEVIGDNAAGLDPDDPWALKVEELASTEDASAARNEVAEMVYGGTMDAGHGDRIDAAILARFPDAERDPELFGKAAA
jgi:hypothetical protein